MIRAACKRSGRVAESGAGRAGKLTGRMVRSSSTSQDALPARCNPVGRLHRPIPMALEVEQRLDEAPTPLGSSVHAPRDLGNERGSLGVLIQGEKKIIRRITVQLTELIDALGGTSS